MRLVFADTFYWISFVNPKDEDRQRVIEVFTVIQPCKLVTTDDVLIELLAFYSKSGFQFRQRTTKLIRGILNSSDTQVLPQSHSTFLDGLELYENRLDKGYSLTDCISMNVMRQLQIVEVLTQDKHFAQEGFTIIL